MIMSQILLIVGVMGIVSYGFVMLRRFRVILGPPTRVQRASAYLEAARAPRANRTEATLTSVFGAEMRIGPTAAIVID